MILDKTVKIKTVSQMVKYYKDLGYECEYGSIIDVSIEHLPKKSMVKVNVLCDYCKDIINFIPYKDAHKINDPIHKYACKGCKGLKIKESNLIKYGVENVNQLPEIKEKKKQICLERYGVDNYTKTQEYLEKSKQTQLNKYGVENYTKTDECQEKMKKTMLERYGVEHCSQSDLIKEKIKNTNLERYGAISFIGTDEYKKKFKETCLKKYGVDNFVKSDVIKEKKRKTNLKRYGVENVSSYKDFKEKRRKTFYENQTTISSIQQRHINNLYNAVLNYPIKYYNADICLLEEQICIEYDGSGHDLTVKKGNMTQEEFDQKEMTRFYVIKRAGYKQIRIVSPKDYLPSDEILLQMLEQAKEYFNTTTHTWVEYNIDTSLMHNAENKEGVFFDFGDLRKIKKIS